MTKNEKMSNEWFFRNEECNYPFKNHIIFVLTLDYFGERSHLLKAHYLFVKNKTNKFFLVEVAK